MAGANPTFSGIWTQFGYLVKMLNELEKFGSSNSPNVLDMEDVLTTALDGEFIVDARAAAKRLIRDQIASPLRPQTMRAMFRPVWAEMLRVIGSTELGPGAFTDADALRVIRQYMVDNDDWIKSRSMTLDTSSSGSVTGTGAIHRLTTDGDGMTLECVGPESKVFFCDVDQNNGASKHAEQFEFRVTDAHPDGLQWTGSGVPKRVTSLNAKSGNLLVNPSFEQGATANNTALTSTGQITGWDVTTAANIKTYSAAAYVYRGYQNDQGVTHYGLEFVASDTLIQVVKTENPGARFDDRVPYYAQIVWQRLASATGTLTFHVGASSVSVDVSTGTNGVWNVLKIAIGTGNWFANFNEESLDVKIQMASLAVGTVVVDDVVLAPMTNLDGTWWAVVGGATPWKYADALTFSGDADGGTRAIFNYWLWRTYYEDQALMLDLKGWFPATANATEVTASGGRTLTFANSGSADTITASSGSFVSDGYKAGMLVTIAGSSSNNMTTGKIATVSATVLTFGSDTSLTNEGPLSATCTLNATPNILDPT